MAPGRSGGGAGASGTSRKGGGRLHPELLELGGHPPPFRASRLHSVHMGLGEIVLLLSEKLPGSRIEARHMFILQILRSRSFSLSKRSKAFTRPLINT